MADVDAGYVGYLDRLADALNLSRPERLDLAFAYTFEDRRSDPQAEDS